MDEDELRRAGEGEPTVDRINVEAFDSQEKLREWSSQIAGALVGTAGRRVTAEASSTPRSW